MSIEVTDVKINVIQSESKIRAFAKVTLNDSICIRSIKVIDGSKGLFIGMPSVKDKQGDYQDIVFPINAETRKILEEAILKEYKGEEDNPFGE